jgi:hypothetical protein
MAKQTAVSEAKDRPYNTTGVHLPADLWELLNRVAFERARTRGVELPYRPCLSK